MSGDSSRDPVFECAGMHFIFRRLNYSQIIVRVALTASHYLLIYESLRY